MRPGGAEGCPARALLLGLALAACTAAPRPALRPQAGPAPAELEREIHALVDQHRVARGLAPLVHDERIAEQARRHSRAMAARESLGHEGFDQRVAAIRAAVPVGGAAENVAYDSGRDLARRVVAGWLSSPGHRENIEGPYDLTGIGVARAAGGRSYFTQIFVARAR